MRINERLMHYEIMNRTHKHLTLNDNTDIVMVYGISVDAQELIRDWFDANLHHMAKATYVLIHIGNVELNLSHPSALWDEH